MDQDASDRVAGVAWVYHVKVYFRTTLERCAVHEHMEIIETGRRGCFSVVI
jgi:hypothetical protein